MSYGFKELDGDCDECGTELFFSSCPHSDICDDCYELEIINEECPAPIGHFMHKEDE